MVIYIRVFQTYYIGLLWHFHNETLKFYQDKLLWLDKDSIYTNPIALSGRALITNLETELIVPVRFALTSIGLFSIL